MSCDNSANRDHSHSHDHEQCAAPEAVAITSSLLEEKVRAGIANVSHVKATDLSDGCGSKFELVVVSSEFMGKAIIGE
jgi:stress-induced morphogen